MGVRRDRSRDDRGSRHVAIVTRDGARVAGFAIMTFGQERGHLVLLAVRPSHQRGGIAHRMLAWLTETAVVAGRGFAPRGAARHQPRGARRSTGAEGFAETVRVPGYYRGREAGVRMMRLLRNPGCRCLRGSRRRSTAARADALLGLRRRLAQRLRLVRFRTCVADRACCARRAPRSLRSIDRARRVDARRGRARGPWVRGKRPAACPSPFPPSCWEAGAATAPTRWSRRKAPQ
jgi:GNAT superfamily N-acetyltransferase